MTVSLHGDAALAYAARGWRVMPTWWVDEGGECRCKKGPICPKPGKHPIVRSWQVVATTDPAQVTAWWTEWPDANVSVVLGEATGMFALDVDPRSGGQEAIERYVATSQFGLPRTLKAVTGSGGYHLFYRVPPGVTVRNVVGKLVNLAGELMPGVDVRGEGGQVVAPPSRHTSGGFYTWADCWEEGAADAPEELLRVVLGGGGSDGGSGGGAGGKEALPASEDILRGIPEGERNDTLFRWACQLRRKLGDDRGAVEVLVREAARNSGLGQDEVNVILSSAFAQDHSDAGMYGFAALSSAQEGWASGSPSTGVQGGLEGSQPGLAGGDAGVFDGDHPLALPLTDEGNAERFVRAVGADFRYVPERGDWLAWDGRRWAPCLVLEHQAAAQAVGVDVWKEAADVEDAQTKKQVEAWARASQMQGKRDAMLGMAKPKLAVPAAGLDADDWALVVKNGTLDLRTGVLRPHRREDMCTLAVDTAYDPEARCESWERFLENVLPDPEVRWYVQKAVGYSLTGTTDAKALFILHGSGSNGKSVFLEALRRCVIGEYAGVAPKTLIMQERDEHATQLAGLQGKRFVTLSEEVEERDRLRTATLKSITGGDEMTARFMRQDFFSFVPKMKLWIATNHRPGVGEFGEAMKTRLRMVPFTVRIPEEARRERDEVLREFDAEASGLLAWAVKGLAGWRAEGLTPPGAVWYAVEEWLDSEDVLGQWMEERLVDPATSFAGGSFTTTADLHRDYVVWMAMRGEERYAVSTKSLGKRLASAGYRNDKREGTRGWWAGLLGGQTWGV